MAARKKKVIDLEPYSALDQHCIALHEYYKALRRAGFCTDVAFWLISDRDSFPDWILPSMPNRIDPIPYEDEEDD